MLNTVILLLVIPLAFDVGGEDCGLSFTLVLTVYYFVLSLFYCLTRQTRLHALYKLVSFCQFLILPILLIYHLNAFSTEATGAVKTFALNPWKRLMQWSTPAFTLLEGFATLLVIQSCGRISRYLVNYKSDSWMIALLAISGTVISWSAYFLYRIYSFPAVITITDGTLIGALLTSAIILCAYGVGSGKGNMIESSLLFAYLVFCVYGIFSNFKADNPTPAPKKPDPPPFPPFVMESARKFASSIPETIAQMMSFLSAAFSSLSPSVCISIGYRSMVLYLTTRMIPRTRAFASSEPIGRFISFVFAFSPCILICAYTHLLMSHMGMIDDAGVWRWVNAFGVLVLYAVEILYGAEQDTSEVIGEWKLD